MNSSGVGMGELVSQHFTLMEFRCPCGLPNCDAPILPPDLFLSKFEQVREEYGRPIFPGSWARCIVYNGSKKIGGSLASQHLHGNAVDIAYRNLNDLWELIGLFMNHGFSVIVYSAWIHVDLRPGKPLFMRGLK